MQNYSTYIFDLDGTITDTVSVWLDIFHESLRHFGITPPDKKVLAKHTHDFREMFKFGLPEEKLIEFDKVVSALANKLLPTASLHTAAYDLLRHLRDKGKKTAIFSATQRINFDPIMRHHNLYSVVQIAVAGDDVSHFKPHPAGIFKALEDLGVAEVDHKTAVYIGDKDTDILAAYNAGIDSILYYPPEHQEIYDLEELKKHKPTHIITSWQELIEYPLQK